jgi:iron complex transport system permease protein
MMSTSRWQVMRLARGDISIRFDSRVGIVLLGLVILIVGVAVWSIGYGEYPISPWDVLKTLAGQNAANPDYDFVIYTLRLPRIVTALLVGMALAVSGAILQGLTRNPLAAPDIIGVNAGAGLVAVSLIVLFPSIPFYFLPISAFLGALITALSIYVLAWNQGSSPVRLILVGIGVGAIASAFTSLLVTFGEINSVSQALIWLTGSVYGRSWPQVTALLPWLVVCLPLVFWLARDLDILALGDEVATGLGTPVERRRAGLLLLSVALAGASVATAGLIGFVGLMAPHLTRQLVGQAHQGVILISAALGALIVVAADLLGRSLFAPIELPCGLITALIGAPYFLFLLYRTRKS